jgi:hypothetical protein
LQTNLTGQQYGALSSGYKSALDAAMSEGQLQNQVAQTQGNLAGKEQELGLTGTGAMTKAGAEQQAFNQAQINAPLANATNVAALMKGYQIPTAVTETFKGPMAGVYGASPLSQVTGLGALIGSGISGTTNAAGVSTPGWLSTLYNKAMGLTDTNPTTPNPNNSNQPLTPNPVENTNQYPHTNTETGETYFTDQP